MTAGMPRVAAPAGAAGTLALMVLATLSMAASGVADTAAVPPVPSSSVAQVPIQVRELSCPDLSTSGTSSVYVSSQGTGTGSLLAGVARLQDLPTTGGVSTVTNNAESGVRVAAAGPPAAGLLALRHDITSDTAASAECLGAGAEWWFAGGGASVAHRSFLLLRNPDPVDAALQLRVFTAQGEVEPVVDAQILVPGNSQQKLDLSRLTSIQDEMTVSVTAERGLVVASMHDSLSSSADSPASAVYGQSWLSGQLTPQRTLVFGGDLSDDTSDQLVVTNATGQSATVSVEVASVNGWFAPQDVSSFTLGAGQVTNIDLSGTLDGGVSAVRVVSTRAVVGVLRRGSGDDMTDAEPLPELNALAAAVVAEGDSAALVVVGGSGGGTATVAFSSAAGKVVESHQVSLTDGETTVIDLPSGAIRVDLAPGAGSVYAGVTVRGPGIDSVAVRPLVLTVRQPNVTPVFR